MPPNDEKLILLTNLAVVVSNDVVVEQQCGDCACPDPDEGIGWSDSPGPEHDAVAYQLADIHFGRVASDFFVGFNPLHQASPVAFNTPVRRLLEAFHRPNTLADGVWAAGNPAQGLPVAQQLVKHGLLEPAGATRQLQPAQPQTLTAWLHVTNDCNLLCTYCYVHKTPDPMTVAKGQAAVDAVFRSALANGFQRIRLKYAGGEATLNFAAVLAMHTYAQSLANQHGLNLEGVVLSNGVALTNQMIDAMRAHQLRLMISLDGIGEYHDTQRPFVNGHGSFAHVERSLDRLAVRGLTPSITITVSQQNLAGLAALVEYVMDRELPFTFNFYRENDCSASYSELAYQQEAVIAAMQAAFAVIEAKLPPYSLLDRLVDLARLDVAHDRTCGVGQSYMVVNQSGGVAKCHMFLEQTVTDVGAPDPLRLIREDEIGVQNMPVDEKEGCRDCHWRYWCAGGCPALTYRVSGRYDIKSPNCRIYKALFPEVLRLEGLRLLKYGGLLN